MPCTGYVEGRATMSGRGEEEGKKRENEIQPTCFFFETRCLERRLKISLMFQINETTARLF
jgi:hypothetical protein